MSTCVKLARRFVVVLLSPTITHGGWIRVKGTSCRFFIFFFYVCTTNLHMYPCRKNLHKFHLL